MSVLTTIYEALPMSDEETSTRNSDIRSVLAWIVGINATLIVTGVVAVTSVLWGQSVQLTKIAANQEGAQSRFTELSQQIAAASAGRYLSSDAATDRAAIMSTLNSVREAWTASSVAIQAENTQQARYINELLIKVTRLEERSGMKGTP